jgi:chromosomal replication initiator protein
MMWPRWYQPLAQPTRRARVADIITLASCIFNIPVVEIKGQRRFKHLAMARFAICVIAKEHGHSFPSIGRVLGGRDHSTIINATKKAAEFAQRDPDFAVMIHRLRRDAITTPAFVPDRVAA